jgi:hypothetical protein
LRIASSARGVIHQVNKQFLKVIATFPTFETTLADHSNQSQHHRLPIQAIWESQQKQHSNNKLKLNFFRAEKIFDRVSEKNKQIEK